jgi:2-(1,2-epoxy-1,2-dihydrophenyl)acetyl-CoA isomerase
MHADAAPLIVTHREALLTITLNQPVVLNAIDLAMATALHTHLAEAAQDRSVRSIIITGAGRGFCAGGNLQFAVDANPERPGDSFLALTEILHRAIETIRTLPKPVIAAINGPAAGAGLFLALACDLRVMATSAYLKQSNTSYGLSIPAGGTFLLPRLVGLARALEIALLDEPILPDQALALGLVNQLAPDETLLVAAEALAQRAAAMPLETIGRVKRLFNSSFAATLAEQLTLERRAVADSADDPEGREGVAAFLQKRQPIFVINGMNR